MLDEFDEAAAKVFDEQEEQEKKEIAPKTVEDAEIENVFNLKRENQKSSMAASMLHGSKQSPAQQPEIAKYADKYKLDPGFVQRNLKTLQEKDKSNNLDYDDLIANNPGVSKWLEKPINAATGQNEIDKLKDLEKHSAKLTPNFKAETSVLDAAGTAIGSSYYNLKASAFTTLKYTGMMDSADAAQGYTQAKKDAAAIAKFKPEYAKEFSKTLHKESGDIDKAIKSFSNSYGELKKEFTYKALSGVASDAVTTVGEALDIVTAISDNPEGAIYTGTESVINIVPTVGGGLVGKGAGTLLGNLLPGIGPVAGQVLGEAGYHIGSFAGSFVTEFGASFDEDVSKRLGVNGTDPLAVERLFNDKNLVDKFGSRSARKAVGTASMDVLFNMLAGKVFGSAVKGAKLAKGATRFSKEGLKQLAKTAAKAGAAQATEVVGEGFAEFSGVFLREKGDLSEMSSEDIVAEMVGALFSPIGPATFLATKAAKAVEVVSEKVKGKEKEQSFEEQVNDALELGTVVKFKTQREKYNDDVATAVQEFNADVALSRDAYNNAINISKIAETIQNLEDTNKVPGAIRELVALSSESEEISNIYFQGDEFDNFLTSNGIIPSELINEMSEEMAVSYKEHKANGTALAIPLSDFAEHISTKEELNGITEFARAQEDGMNLAEARIFNDEIGDTLNALTADATVQQAKEVREKSEITILKETFKESLKDSGVPQEVINANAEIYIANIVSEAALNDMTPSEYRTSRGLEIRTLNGEGVSKATQEGLSQAIGKAAVVEIAKTEESLKEKTARKIIASGEVDPGKINEIISREKEIEKGVAESIKLDTAQVERTLEDLNPKQREFADEMIEDMMEQMAYEVDQAEPGHRKVVQIPTEDRNVGAFKTIISSSKSTYPSYYSTINAKNKADFKKIMNSKKGVRYERMQVIAMERLKYGYSDQTAGNVYPDNTFRNLMGLPSVSETGEINTIPFTLFQSGLTNLENGYFLKRDELAQHEFSDPESVEIPSIKRARDARKTVNNPINVKNLLKSKYLVKGDSVVMQNDHTSRDFVISEIDANSLVDQGLINYDRMIQMNRPEGATRLWELHFNILKNMDQAIKSAVYVGKRDVAKGKEHLFYSLVNVGKQTVSVSFTVEARNGINFIREIDTAPVGEKNLPATSLLGPTTAAASETGKLPSNISINDFKNITNDRRVALTHFQQDQAVSTDEINHDKLGFYSKLRTEVGTMQFKAMPAKDLANRINKLQGVKKDELEYTGILDYLNAHEGKITKEEVLAFIDNNGLKIDQIVFGSQINQNGSIQSGEISWSEPEADPDSFDYDHFYDSEYDYYRNEQDEETYNSVKRELATELEKEVEDLTEDEISNKLDKWAEERTQGAADNVTADDQPWYYQFVMEESSSGMKLIRLGEDSDWYSPDAQEHFSYNDNEAQIEFQEWAIENGHIEISRNYTRESVGWTVPTTSSEGVIEFQAEFTGDLENVQGVSISSQPGSENEWLVSFEKWNGDEEQSVTAETVEDIKEFILKELEEQGELSEIITPEDAANVLPHDTPIGNTQWIRFTVPGGTNYRELLLTIPQQSGIDFYNGTHFSGYKNFLAHARMKDRVNKDGGKVLFIEEIQSDWQQEGREKGFIKDGDSKKLFELDRSIGNTSAALDKARSEVRNSPEYKTLEEEANALRSQLKEFDRDVDILKREKRDLVNSDQSTPDEIFKAEDRISKLEDESDRLFTDRMDKEKLQQSMMIEAGKELGGKKNDLITEKEELEARVPDAPFQDTEAWMLLTFKRMLRMAADYGYKNVQWTPASVHQGYWGSERIAWEKVDGKWLVSAKRQIYGLADGVDIEAQAVMRGEQIERNSEEVNNKEDLRQILRDVLSKDKGDRSINSLTDQIWAQIEANEPGLKEPRHEGMDFFYNQMMPKVIGKYVKKLDKNAKVNVVEQDGQEVWNVDMTDKLLGALNGGQTLFQDKKAPRGQIELNQGDAIITMFKEANDSTLLHEMAGHLFLDQFKQTTEYIRTIEAPSESQIQRLEDEKVVKEFLGTDDFSSLSEEQEEKWARATEKYFMEGNAPTEALRKVFAKFKVWLINIYKSLTNKNIDVELTDAVRDVMGRIIAGDQRTAKAEDTNNMSRLFEDARSVGMPEQAARKYEEAILKASMSAEEELTAKLMDDIRKKELKVYKEKKKQVKKTVELQVDLDPRYQAVDFFRNGEIDDGSPAKLSKESIIEVFGKDKLKELPKGVYSIKSGIHINVMASMFGFDSGNQMIESITNLPKKDAAIKAETDRIMSEEFPDLLSDEGMLELAATQAAFNEDRSKVLRMELEYLMSNEIGTMKELIRKVSKKIPTNKQVKDQAVKAIGNMDVSNIKPHLFQGAARKSAKLAGELLAKGDIDGAFKQKLNELLNYELFRQATKVKEQISKDLKSFKKFRKSDKDLAKTRDVNLVNAGRVILSKYGLSNADPEKLANDLENIREYDPDGYNTMIALIQSVDYPTQGYKDLSYDEFSSMSEAVKAIWGLSRSNKLMEIDGKLVEKEKVVSDLIAAIAAKVKGGPKLGELRSPDKKDDFKIGLLGFKASLRRVESWTDLMDAGDKEGTFTKFIFRPVSEAADIYRVEKAKRMEQFKNATETIGHTITKNEISAKELGFIFKDKGELLGALLHIGNDSNKRKLLLGKKWAVDLGDGVLDTRRWDNFISRMHSEKVITKADMDYVQSVWDMMEDLKPAAQKAHKEMYGYFFEEVTANEIVTPFGKYKGGYAPAVTDPRIVEDAQIREDQASFEEQSNSFMFPTSGRGFTKSRVEYNKPLVMDLRIFPQHLDKVLRFTHIEPRVKEVASIVNDEDFRDALFQLDPTLASEMLVPFLQRAAQQKVETPANGKGWKMVANMAKALRTNTGLNIMFGNVTNTFQQFTGLSIAALRVERKHLRNATWTYVRDSANVQEFIDNKSDFMKERVGSQLFSINTRVEEILLNPSKFEKGKEFARQHGYFLQEFTQNIVDNITWLAAYEQAVEQRKTEKQAIREANSTVRESQGSFNAEDISEFESGTAFRRFFTMFYSYFNMLANFLGTEFAKNQEANGLRKGAGRHLYIYTMGFMLPAFLSELIVISGSGKLDEDDDDEYMDDVIAAFFGSQVRTGTALFPIAGPIVQSGINSMNDKWYDDRISTSPAISVLEGAIKAPNSVYKAMVKDGNKKKAMRDTLSLIAIMSGVPVIPLARPIGYGLDISEGKAKPTGPIDAARGFITGKSGK